MDLNESGLFRYTSSDFSAVSNSRKSLKNNTKKMRMSGFFQKLIRPFNGKRKTSYVNVISNEVLNLGNY